jgi:cell division protease FtsH
MRAGRFDRQIFVIYQTSASAEIFKAHFYKKSRRIRHRVLAKQTQVFRGAEICCNEAALIAARYNKTAVDKQDF